MDNVVSSMDLKVSETRRLNFDSEVDDCEQVLAQPELKDLNRQAALQEVIEAPTADR